MRKIEVLGANLESYKLDGVKFAGGGPYCNCLCPTYYCFQECHDYDSQVSSWASVNDGTHDPGQNYS